MTLLRNIHKIAVLRATALGDFLAATPALHALRAAYPDAEIVYLGNPWHKTFLGERPSPIDRVIVVPVSRGVRLEHGVEPNPADLDPFFDSIRHERFDLGIQMHGGGVNSNPFLLRAGAAFNVGMCTPDAPRLDRWMPYLFYQNEVARLLELVSLVGAHTDDWTPRIAVTDRDRISVAERLPMLSRPYAVLHPGASDPRRRWPADRFAQVGDALFDQGLSVLVTGTGPERPVVEAVIDAMQRPALNLCDGLPLGGLAALLQGAALMVSNDTGPLHLANAVGAPNIGIYWCGNYFNWSHVTRTRHRPLIAWMLRCPLCGEDMSALQPSRKGCAHDACFVETVGVEEVLTHAHDLLALQQEGVPR